MTHRIHAIYEKGVLKPQEPLNWLSEYDRVEFDLDEVKKMKPYPFRNWPFEPIPADVADQMEKRYRRGIWTGG